MINLVNSIKEGSRVQIGDSIFVPKAKAIYATVSNPESWYAKVLFDQHRVLVVSPHDDYMAYGTIKESLECNVPGPTVLSYDGDNYQKEVDDYQIVLSLDFGNPLEIEGEVLFSDYTSGDKVISIGVIARTGERADMFGSVISIEDVKVLEA